MSFGGSAPGSLGVEEELFLVDAETLEPVPIAAEVVPEPGPRVKHELFASVVEITTPVCADAAEVFAPQKGAGPEEVRRLTARLGRLARKWRRDPRGVPLTGAAGGLSGGLWARLGAALVPGAAFVLDRLDFDSRMRAARAVVTGEGCLDAQSLAGKAVSEVATRARQAGVPCYAIVGGQELDSFGIRILDLQAVLEAGTLAEIGIAARRLAELI